MRWLKLWVSIWKFCTVKLIWIGLDPASNASVDTDLDWEWDPCRTKWSPILEKIRNSYFKSSYWSSSGAWMSFVGVLRWHIWRFFYQKIRFFLCPEKPLSGSGSGSNNSLDLKKVSRNQCWELDDLHVFLGRSINQEVRIRILPVSHKCVERTEIIFTSLKSLKNRVGNKKPTKNVLFFYFFLFFMKIIQTFLFETDFLWTNKT